jgi:precorrin-6B methylase 2
MDGTDLIDLPGWFTAADIAAYRSLLNEVPENGVTVEVGSWKGRSLVNAAIARPDLRMIAVDTFAGSPSEIETHHREAARDGDRVFRAFARHICRSECRNLSVLRMNSEQAAPLFGEATLDLVFIDGDHEYDQVSKDIAAWQRTVAPGGRIAGHDYRAGNGVAAAVHERFDDGAIERFDSISVWAVRV